MIEVRGVSKQFDSKRGAVEALSKVNLRIERGEFVCLVGPSGCGKTTLLNLIAGLEKPDKGQILVDGRRVKGPGPDRGMMFQEAALFPWLTIRKNVEFALKMIHVPRRERRERAMRWLGVVGMTAFAEANVHELSGGMRQRAALARALALEADVLLMDEPLAALDVHGRRELHAEIERVWLETHKTIVFVTHDIGEAVSLASRVLVLGRRPSRVRHDIRIDLPRPRDLDDPEVSALGREVTGEIPNSTPGADREAPQPGARLPGGGASPLGARP